MAQIKLINKTTGRTDVYPLASVDWDDLTAVQTPYSATMANVSDVTDTHKTFYYFDNADVSTIDVLDTIRPDSTESLFRLGTAAAFRDNFQAESAAIPWASYDTLSTWQVPVQNANALEGHGTFTPNRLYYSNDTASVDYKTAAGGEIGGALGMYGASGNVYALMCIGAKQTYYMSGAYQQTNPDLCARWQGNGCIDFSLHPTRNFSTAPVSVLLGIQTINPIPAPVGLVAQCVYTEINGYPYVAMCALSVDSTGKAKLLSGVFIPAWFWGEFTQPEDPADIPQYHGYDAVTDRTSGTYTYTPNDIELPTAYQPVSSVSDVAFGLHVYRISDADYMNIQQTLWGKGSLSDSLWNRWNNYKFNPVAGIIGCHVLPKAFMPDVQGMSYSQPRAAGCGLVSTGQSYHVNGQTTITDSASTVNMPEYFSSHLNWDPYTSVQLFLPFCGWISIPADRCIDTKDGSTGSISIQYRCDIITGNVCCFVRCFNADGVNTYSTMATGNAAISVPITGNDNGTGQIVGAITAGAGLAVGALTGVGGLALAAGAAGAGLAVNTARHTMQTGSTYSGNVAALGCLQPYLLITMPVEHTSETWRDLHGLPSGLGLTVGDLAGTGYTEMSEIHAEIGCTAEEQAEIEALMKAGVIL